MITDEDLEIESLLKAMIVQIRETQALMKDKERKELWDQIQSGYCPLCGSNQPPCFCDPRFFANDHHH